MIVKRGEVYFADLDPAVGSEQGGFRPVVIIQNDVRKFSDNTMEKIDFALSISVSENIHEIRSRARNQIVQILSMSCMIKLPILSGYVAASAIYLYYRKKLHAHKIRISAAKTAENITEIKESEVLS